MSLGINHPIQNGTLLGLWFLTGQLISHPSSKAEECIRAGLEACLKKPPITITAPPFSKTITPPLIFVKKG